jgi:hypothetical protein
LTVLSPARMRATSFVPAPQSSESTTPSSAVAISEALGLGHRKAFSGEPRERLPSDLEVRLRKGNTAGSLRRSCLRAV